MSKEGPVFVVGMPRSGTTLMRSILNAHPSMALAPETHFINHWMQVHRHTNLADPEDFDRFWGEYTVTNQYRWLGLDPDDTKERIHAAGTPTFRSIFTTLLDGFAETQGKQRSGEKTPDNYRHLDVLFEWYPTARVIYMIRDPRAVVASFKALDRAWTDKPIEEVAARWRRSAERAEQKNKDERVVLVRYSELVNAPSEAVRRICEHVREPFDARMLESRATNPTKAWKADSAITTDSLERWRHELTEEEIAVTEHLSRGPFDRLGFERVAAPLPHRTQLTLDAKNLGRRALGTIRNRIR